MTQETI